MGKRLASSGGDWLPYVVVLGSIFGALWVIDYKLKHPKCRWCGVALEVFEMGAGTYCPECRRVVTALDVLLA